nr:Rab family GTPase [Candidatus Sigynarchaeota archaeon]
MSKSFDYNFKIVTGGAGGVGKTTFLHRYLTNQFFANTALTVGVQLHSHLIERQGKKISLVIWDLGGQEHFRFVQDKFIKGAVAGLVFFDISSIGSILQVPEWVTLFRKNAAPNIPILLVGTKMDIASEEMQQQAETEAAIRIKELDLCGYIATSSKWGKNVEEAIYSLVDALLVQRMSATGTAHPSTAFN